MNNELLALSKTVREIVVDTGCNWTEAAAKALQGARLSKADRDYLTAYGLGQLAHSSLDRPRRRPGDSRLNAEELAAQALAPFVSYASLVRIFEVDGTRKRFLDLTIDELGTLADSLKRRAASVTASARFAIDTGAEMQRVGAAVVSDLPPETLQRLDGNAPW